VDVRVLGVVVNNGDPFEFCEKAFFDPFHQTASVPFKIHPLAEFRRDNDLEHSLVAGRLPRRQTLRNVHGGFGRRKPDSFDVLFLGSTVPSDVVSVRLPLTLSLVARISYADGNALVKLCCVRRSRSAAFPPPTGHLDDAQQTPKTICHLRSGSSLASLGARRGRNLNGRSVSLFRIGSKKVRRNCTCHSPAVTRKLYGTLR
jgi:hypothetical protein